MLVARLKKIQRHDRHICFLPTHKKSPHKKTKEPVANAKRTVTMKTKLQLTFLLGLICTLTFGQVQLPTTPTPWTFPTITTNQYMPENIIPIPTVPSVTDFGQDRIRQQNQRLIAEVERNEQLRRQQQNQ